MPISLYNSNEIQLPLVRISGSNNASGGTIVDIDRNYAVELHNVLLVTKSGSISIAKKNDPTNIRLNIAVAGSAYIYQKVILLADENIVIYNAYVNISFIDKAVPAAAVPADLEKTQVPYAAITRPDFPEKSGTKINMAINMAKDTVQTLPVLPTVFDTVPTIRSLREMGYSKKKAKKMLKQIREDHNA